jgi:hypothetical protein
MNPDSGVEPTNPRNHRGLKEFNSFKKFKLFNLLLTSSPAPAGEERGGGLNGAQRLNGLNVLKLHIGS